MLNHEVYVIMTKMKKLYNVMHQSVCQQKVLMLASIGL